MCVCVWCVCVCVCVGVCGVVCVYVCVWCVWCVCVCVCVCVLASRSMSFTQGEEHSGAHCLEAEWFSQPV